MFRAVWGLEGEWGGEAAAEAAVVRGRAGEGVAVERESWGSEVDGRCMITVRRVKKSQWAWFEKSADAWRTNGWRALLHWHKKFKNAPYLS